MWFLHRGYKRIDKQTGKELTMKEVLCAILFNVQGYLYEILKPKEETIQERINRIAFQKEDRPFIEKGEDNNEK